MIFTKRRKRIGYAKCAAFLKQQLPFIPETVVVLGSGHADFVKSLQVVYEISYADIPGFCTPTNEGHAGRLVAGFSEGNRVLVMQGRLHYYEGYDMEEIVFPIRVFCLMGVRNIILTNASGGIKAEYGPGSLVLLKDHISSFVPNPLRGRNDERIGVRFPDSGDIYDKKAREEISRRCFQCGLPVKEGVYVQTQGPAFETPAEIRFYGMIGADIVGMSTACEAIAARHAGLRVSALSCVTNYACGITENKLTIEEVEENIKKVSRQIENVLKIMIEVYSSKGGNQWLHVLKMQKS